MNQGNNLKFFIWLPHSWCCLSKFLNLTVSWAHCVLFFSGNQLMCEYVILDNLNCILHGHGSDYTAPYIYKWYTGQNTMFSKLNGTYMSLACISYPVKQLHKEVRRFLKLHLNMSLYNLEVCYKCIYFLSWGGEDIRSGQPSENDACKSNFWISFHLPNASLTSRRYFQTKHKYK